MEWRNLLENYLESVDPVDYVVDKVLGKFPDTGPIPNRKELIIYLSEHRSYFSHSFIDDYQMLIYQQQEQEIGVLL